MSRVFVPMAVGRYVDIDSDIECIYYRDPLVGMTRFNRDIWQEHFVPLFDNNQVEIGELGLAINIDLGTGNDVKLFADDYWRPGNFKIEVVTSRPAQNETDTVLEKLQTFFTILREQSVCRAAIVGGKRKRNSKKRTTRKTRKTKKRSV